MEGSASIFISLIWIRVFVLLKDCSPRRASVVLLLLSKGEEERGAGFLGLFLLWIRRPIVKPEEAEVNYHRADDNSRFGI